MKNRIKQWFWDRAAAITWFSYLTFLVGMTAYLLWRYVPWSQQ